MLISSGLLTEWCAQVGRGGEGGLYRTVIPKQKFFIGFQKLFTVHIRLNTNIKHINTNYCGMIQAEGGN